MGWFWADAPAAKIEPSQPWSHQGLSMPQHSNESMSPPPGCPMHQKPADAMVPKTAAQCPVDHSSFAAPPPPAASGCPVPHSARASTTTTTTTTVETTEPAAQSTLSKLNPLNYMFSHISQAPAPEQTQALPISREPSTIPKGDGSGEKWEYPSPQQMYNALLRKGYSDTDITAVESMVSVHNFLNEGAWAEILEWEKRFGQGLWRGLQVCSKGEENVERQLRRLQAEDRKLGKVTPARKEEWETDGPSLVRFQGRPRDMTPKAAMIQVLGWLYPAKFGGEPPFDRHDWYVSREINGQKKEVRYVIDYYEGPPEPTGDPVFYLDVRPAATPAGAAERIIRWSSDVWWRASGGEVREASQKAQK